MPEATFMKIEWDKLRTLNGTQQSAFEEICCQLAAYEHAPAGSVFIRKGAPDAGVECFWRLPSGDEWGWQAKFFRSPPDSNQWNQIDASVKRALEKHPRLTSYTVCLPINRQDPRIDEQKWFMDRWEERVNMWTGWAKEKGMSVQFPYWGEHEILERLSREEHRGRYFFWFNKELFSEQWFNGHLDEAISNVGPRYSPELNVELPVARLFDGLGRTPEFYTRIRSSYGELKKTYSKTIPKRPIESIKDKLRSLQEKVQSLLLILQNADVSDVDFIDWNSIAIFCSDSARSAWDCADILETVAREQKEKVKSSKQQHDMEPAERPENLQYASYHLRELAAKLVELSEFAGSSEALLFNLPALLVVGSAGTGKTHLLCDVAKRRTGNELPTVLLLGKHFTQQEPWLQIMRQLGLPCTRDEFLGALEAAAQARDARALIFIDALNEGEGNKIWHNYLPGMLTTLRRFPWIGIALTVRTSYEDVVIPKDLVPQKMIRETHPGFAEHEYQATQTFFDHFGIERPAVPLLVPEFQNPLFLILFCEGLENRRLTKIPPGLQGITAIFEFFVASINEKLSRPDQLDFDHKLQIIQQAISKLAEAMAQKGYIWLPRDEAQTIVNSVLPRNGYEKSLFKQMISEGLLSEDRFWVGDDERRECVSFSYERFTDHLIAKNLLDKYLNTTCPLESFLPDQPLGSLIKDEQASWLNRGLVEALSIQLPERIGKELGELVPNAKDYRSAREAFVESLVWRDYKAITGATLQYINEHVIRFDDTHEQFLNALLTVTQIPTHPYNARFLHMQLMRHELADRDAWWSIFLHYQYGQHSAVDRLVEWAWFAEDKKHVSDDSVMVCAIALAWFLTTSNRFLRDRATKALVSLLRDRIHILGDVIKEFLNVNDPYVSERLYAVAYGCAMRSDDDNAIAELAKKIYEWQFKDGAPTPHILLRDYARGVIELALHRGAELDIDEQRIRPPYKSEWPFAFAIPTKEELEKYRGEYNKDMPEEKLSGLHLYDSVMGFEDFNIYVIGDLTEWSSQRLDEPRQSSRKEIFEEFSKSLTERQRKAFEVYQTIRTNADVYHLLEKTRKLEGFGQEYSEEELQSAIKDSERSLRKLFGKKKTEVFDKDIIPYLDNPHEDEFRFDASIARRWIMAKVLDLGWTIERFGRFDREMVRRAPGKAARKPERIGKKYQWIAYHEFLARLSDNFRYRGTPWSNEQAENKYEGPWQLGYVRDIDPSCLLKETKRVDWGPHPNNWWFPVSYNAWDSETGNTAWLKKFEDLPNVPLLIEVTHPTDNSKWLVLEAYYMWEQPTPIGEERFSFATGQIWYTLKSYIMSRHDSDIIFSWAKEQNFMGRWMPESHDLYRVFLGEFFWSPAFEYHNKPYYHHNGWTNGHYHLIPEKLLVSTDQYHQEHDSYDCSIDDDISIHLPAKWLVDQMKLRWNGVEGSWFDDDGTPVALEPSVRACGPGALLMNRDKLLKFLYDNDYDIVWTVLGEKTILSSRTKLDSFVGRLEISGAYRIHGDELEGQVNTRFIGNGENIASSL